MSEYRDSHNPRRPACVLDEVVTTSRVNLLEGDEEARMPALKQGDYFEDWL